jgi:hypothetical protein
MPRMGSAHHIGLDSGIQCVLYREHILHRIGSAHHIGPDPSQMDASCQTILTRVVTRFHSLSLSLARSLALSLSLSLSLSRALSLSFARSLALSVCVCLCVISFDYEVSTETIHDTCILLLI